MSIIPQIIPQTEMGVKPATYTEIAEAAAQIGFTLGRARRSGVYLLIWTTDTGNQHAFIKSLDRVLPFIAAIFTKKDVQEEGAA